MTDPGLQERVGRLEGRVEDFGDRFDALDRRLDSLERRMEARYEAIEQLQAAMEERMSRQFRWLVGGEVSVLATVVGALAEALFPGSRRSHDRGSLPTPTTGTWCSDLRRYVLNIY